jgi:hypothetical protein
VDNRQQPQTFISRWLVQAADLLSRKYKQAIEIVYRGCIIISQFLTQPSKPHLQADVGLNHAVVKVMGHAITLFLGGVSASPIHQANIVQGQHGALDASKQEVHVRSIKGWSLPRRQVEPVGALLMVAQGSGDKGAGVELRRKCLTELMIRVHLD